MYYRGQLCTLCKRFWSGSDRRKVQPPAIFSQFKHCSLSSRARLSKSGPSTATAGPGKHSGGPLWNFFWILKMAHSVAYYIFERRRAPKHRGARGNLPLLFPFSTGLIEIIIAIIACSETDVQTYGLR